MRSSIFEENFLLSADLPDRHATVGEELGRGSADRDVPGWDFGPPGRGHHRGAVGHPCQPEYGVEPEPEDLRQDRGLAEPADRGRASVPLPRRHCHEAQLGRRGPQRFAAGGLGRQFGRISRDPGDLRGRQGGQIRLVGVFASRPQRRAAGHFRRLQGPCRERGGFPAGGALPTLHGALLPQRL